MTKKYDLKPHTFNPDIYFSNGLIVVEGPSDAAVFHAISDHYESLTEQMDVYIFSCKGKGGIKQYYPLLNDFQLTYCAMVDEDYEYEEYNEFFIKLDGDLENELEKLGWIRNNRNKIYEEECYEFISSVLQTKTGEEAIKNSVFWKVIQNISTLLGVDLETMVTRVKIHGLEN